MHVCKKPLLLKLRDQNIGSKDGLNMESRELLKDQQASRDRGKSQPEIAPKKGQEPMNFL